MAGSTQLSENLDENTNIKVVKLFLMQVSKIVDLYDGYVFKLNGDCVIGVFPADENYTGMSDNSIRACTTIRGLIDHVLCPIFKEKGIPNIGYHIGLDMGVVNVDPIGAAGVISSLDMIGRDMNIAAKIEQKAGLNEILLGRRLYEVLHCSLQARCREVNLGSSWKLQDPERKGIYRVFRYDGIWNCDTTIE